MQSLKIKIEIVLFSVLIMLCTLSYLPIFQTSRELEHTNPLSFYVIIVFITLFLFTFRMKLLIKFKLNKISVLLVLLFGVQLLIINAIVEYEIKVFNEVRPLIIALCGIMIGWNCGFSDKTLKFLLIFFGVLVLFVDVIQIFTNLGLFVIEILYLVNSKNALGGASASATLLFFLLAIRKGNHKVARILYFVMFFALFVCILTIRARTSILISSLLFCFIVFKKFAGKNNSHLILSVFATIILLIIIYLLLPQMAVNYITDSILLGHEDNITSYRVERNKLAIDVIKNSPWLGNISEKAQLPWVHNFPLLQLSNFGIFGGLPVLILYFYLLFVLMIGMFKYDIFNIRNIGFVLLSVSFGISMAEPTFPFGPGTVNVFNFIMFGIASRYNYEQKYLNIKNYE